MVTPAARAKLLARLVSEHHRLLEELFALLQEEPSDAERFVARWRPFRLAFETHLALEELYFLSRLLLHDTRNAEAMQREHDLLRARARQVSDAAEHGNARSVAVMFALETQAHMRHERLLLIDETKRLEKAS